MQFLKSRTSAVIAGAAVLAVVSGVGGAVAAGQIGSAGIKNDSIRSIDVKDGTLRLSDLTSPFRAKVARKGTGEQGPQGPKGEPGDPFSYTGENWSISHRNVIGAGDADLQAGPLDAPYGVGSLMIRTASATDKAAFGNEQDFAGDPVAGLTDLAYSVFTTGENIAKAPAGEFGNMPSIAFEIDPNLETSTSGYSTLVYNPANGAANQWTRIDADADTGDHWALTGDAGTKTGCSTAGSYCTFAEVQEALADGGAEATIFTALITKGRDYAFSGAVDGLRINGTTYDFEPTGVRSNVS